MRYVYIRCPHQRVVYRAAVHPFIYQYFRLFMRLRVNIPVHAHGLDGRVDRTVAHAARVEITCSEAMTLPASSRVTFMMNVCLPSTFE